MGQVGESCVHASGLLWDKQFWATKLVMPSQSPHLGLDVEEWAIVLGAEDSDPNSSLFLIQDTRDAVMHADTVNQAQNGSRGISQLLA